MNGPAQPPFDAGQTLGDFRLLRLVGEGGMGQVWEAEQLGLGRPVALKLVRPGFVTERTLALFAREARAGGRLHHPGLVSVHAYGETDGIAWIAMELVPDARTFQDVVAEAVREERPFREVARRVLTICARVADAIQAAHDVGVIHRDLKPQNILVTEDDEPRVVDFGLARILDETRLTQSGFFAGTCLYMSPEQIEGRQRLLDRRTDVFSLGVILYEALAGFHPFEGATLIEVAQRILHNEPRPLDDVRPSLSRDLAATVARCLEKDSDGRYPSMSALAADLRHLLANERVHPRRASAIRRALLWPRRHLDRVFMAVVTIAALVNGIQWRTVAAKERTDVRLQARLDLLRNWRAALEARTVIGPISEGDEDALDTLAEAVSDPVVEETEELHEVLRRRREQAGLRPVDAIRLEAAGEALELAREVRSALDDLGDLKSPLSLAGRAEIRSRWASIVRSWESSDAPTPRFDFYPLAQRGPGRACPRFLVLGTGRAPVWLEAEGRWAFDERTGVVVALLPRDERTSPPSRLYVQVTEWTSGVESRVGPGGGSWTTREASASPLTLIEWEDAAERARSIGGRLPSEAEWEHACRAGCDGAWCFGDEANALARYAWFLGNSGRYFHPVARRRPNPWGLHDMHGNAWEWCDNGWAGETERASVYRPATRGGSCNEEASRCRSASRQGHDPDIGHTYVGFRVVFPADA